MNRSYTPPLRQVAYNDDSSRRHGMVTHFPAEDHASGDMRQVFDYDTGRKLGDIPQPSHTYNVMANSNEHGIVIAETTHGGLSELDQSGKDHRNGTIMDYGR